MKYKEKYLCNIETFDEQWEVYLKSRANLTTADGSAYDGMTVNAAHEIHMDCASES